MLGAAREEIDAFVNIDYQHAQDSIDAVAAGATGDFAKQYTPLQGRREVADPGEVGDGGGGGVGGRGRRRRTARR